MKAGDLFSLEEDFDFRSVFSLDDAPWEWIPKIGLALESVQISTNPEEHPSIPSSVVVEGDVFLHPSVRLGHHVVIQGPAFIGANTEIRAGAFIRGRVIVGKDCVLGNSCEFKNCLLLNKVQVSHFNYVGDSVLGNHSHLGAGSICSNLRLDQSKVKVRLSDGVLDSGLKKLGAMIGDGAEVGCNTVLNPGTILGRRSLVYPSISFGGYLEAGMIAGVRRQEIRVARRD